MGLSLNLKEIQIRIYVGGSHGSKTHESGLVHFTLCKILPLNRHGARFKEQQ